MLSDRFDVPAVPFSGLLSHPVIAAPSTNADNVHAVLRAHGNFTIDSLDLHNEASLILILVQDAPV